MKRWFLQISWKYWCWRKKICGKHLRDLEKIMNVRYCRDCVDEGNHPVIAPFPFEHRKAAGYYENE